MNGIKNVYFGTNVCARTNVCCFVLRRIRQSVVSIALLAILLLGMTACKVDAAAIYVQESKESATQIEGDDNSRKPDSKTNEDNASKDEEESDRAPDDPLERQDSEKSEATEINSNAAGETNIITTFDPSQLESTIGFPKRINQKVIKGSKLVAKPMRDKGQPIVVRIVDTYTHGDHFRYDIEYRGLEPGEYNIADFLIREDGSDTPVDPINVKVNSILGPGQVVPYRLPPKRNRYSSIYLPIMLALGAVWVGGLLIILFYGRGKKKRPSGEAKKVTVAERIEPLLDATATGKLDSQQ